MSEPLATFTVTDADGGAVRVGVRGEVDMTNADELATTVDDALAGRGALVLDLDAAEYLDSHALRVVQRLVDRHVGGSLDLTVVASPGGVAGRLLELTAVGTQVPVVAP